VKQVRERADLHEQAFTQAEVGETGLRVAASGTDARKPYLEHAPWLMLFSVRKGGLSPAPSCLLNL